MPPATNKLLLEEDSKVFGSLQFIKVISEIPVKSIYIVPPM